VIPPGFIQELLARTDVVAVVGRHVELKKAGINYKGLCPFHGEKTPSFIVSPSRQTYHCFGCGVHGDAIRFLVEHLGLNFVEAVKDLAQGAGLVVPEEETTPQERAQAAEKREQQLGLCDLLEKAAEHYRKQLKGNQRAVAYLKGRGLTGEIAARFGLGYAPEGWRTLASVFPRYDDPLLVEAGLVIVQGEDEAEQKRYDRFRDRIMFPIRNVKGETIAFGGRVLDKGEPKYLNSPETPIFVKGRELYGLYEGRAGLRAKGYALVTEGYMDVVALAQLGFPNAVATLGTACTADHVHKLLRFTEQVVFSFDGDAAGRRAAGRALEAALPHASDTRSFRFLFLPPEHDPDSYVREFGSDAFEAQVRNAVPLSRQLLEHAAIECDLASAEGRARMLAQAKPLWQTLPDGALKLQLLGELAIRGGLPADELSRLWQAGGGARGRAAPEDGAEAGDGAPPRAYDERRPRWRRRGEPEGDGLPRPQGRRQPPKRPEDRVVQMLFGEPAWWDDLPADEHDLLHHLPAPHGTLIAWLERELAEHGPRSWAVVREALEADETLGAEARALADGDADPGATPADLRRAMDTLLVRELGEQMKHLIAEAASRREALAEYRVLESRWKDAKARLTSTGQD
jgi:DNA primase